MYSAIFRKLIREAKKSYYSNLVKISTNSVKTIWNIVKNNTGKIQTSDKTSKIKLETHNTKDSKEIERACNNFLISIIESLNSNHANLNMAIQY
jgi:hypothetical protein